MKKKPKDSKILKYVLTLIYCSLVLLGVKFAFKISVGYKELLIISVLYSVLLFINYFLINTSLLRFCVLYSINVFVALGGLMILIITEVIYLQPEKILLFPGSFIVMYPIFYAYLSSKIPVTFEDKVKKGTKIRTKARVKVQSQGEKNIANFLHKNGIKFLYDKKMVIKAKQKNNFGGNTHLVRPDFYLTKSKVVIEFWGLMGNESYDKNTEKKKKLYKESKIKLISVEPSHLKNLEEYLAKELRKKGIKVKKISKPKKLEKKSAKPKPKKRQRKKK